MTDEKMYELIIEAGKKEKVKLELRQGAVHQDGAQRQVQRHVRAQGADVPVAFR
jgi:hypothetical protein